MAWFKSRDYGGEVALQIERVEIQTWASKIVLVCQGGVRIQLEGVKLVGWVAE